MKVFACFAVVVAAGCASAPSHPVAARPSFNPESPLGAPAVPAFAASDASAAVAALAAAPAPQDRPASGQGGGDAPEVEVRASRTGSTLREDRLVGENAQPEWTTRRRFATTRAYVLAPGQIEVEQWLKMHAPRGESPDHFWQTEVGIGLPGRWQIDLYENYGDEGHDTPTKHIGNQIEVRYALAEWGEIPLNPTLYEEVKINHRAPEVIESKILLAEDLAPGCHWAINFFHEQQMGDDRETELGAATGVAWALCDSKISVGAEAKWERVTADGSRGSPVSELLVGPSLQWRPTENTHVDLTPLMGLSHSDRRDPRYEVYVVIGWDFGPEQKEAHAPTSTRSR